MNISKSLYFKNRKDLRAWLNKNHKKKEGVWLLHYKKNTKKQGVLHKEALEEALCFGWIDSTLKSINSEKFILKYTPRKENSIWSKLNKDTAEKLIKEGKMTKTGLEKIEEAKKNGKWQVAYTSRKKLRIPSDLKKELDKSQKALFNFKNFANTYQNMYIGWVIGAKTKETRKKRIKEVFKKAKENKKLYFM